MQEPEFMPLFGSCWTLQSGAEVVAADLSFGPGDATPEVINTVALDADGGFSGIVPYPAREFKACTGVLGPDQLEALKAIALEEVSNTFAGIRSSV